MTLGTGAAENDGDFLTECFVQTPEFQTLLDYSDRKMILLGRTGSGKTALLKEMERHVEVYVQVRPDIFAMQYISNVPFISNLVDCGINLEIFYKFLWLHEIMSKTVKEYFDHNKQNFLDRFVRYFTNRNRGRVEQMKKYFQSFGNIFFERNCAERITKTFESEVEAKTGFKSSYISGQLSESEKKEIQVAASEFINTTQITQLKNIITLFRDYLATNKQKKVCVVIDDLDQNWTTVTTKYQMLSALLDTIRFFADMPCLKIILAMRSDLLTKTCDATNRQNEKDYAFTLKLNWTTPMLLDMMNKRVQHLFAHKYQKSYKVSFENIFVDHVNDMKTSDYLISRTMMRPRDIITLVNYCIENAEESSIIDAEAIIAAEREFLHNRIDALKAEWNSVYPAIETIINLVYQLPSFFSLNDVQAKYEAIETALLRTSKEDDPLVKAFLESTSTNAFGKEQNCKTLVGVWFTIGLIGKRERGATFYSDASRERLDERDFLDADGFEVHPLFSNKRVNNHC